jgi:hypothetical protein
MSTADVIEQRLIESIGNVESVPVPRSLAGWDAQVDHLHAPFGYARPTWDKV